MNTPIVVIVMENHSYGPNDPGVSGSTTKYIVGNPVAPYVNQTLIPQGTLFANYDANAHPSLPDYLDMTAGTNAGCTIDTCPTDSIAADNFFHLLGKVGVSFDTFAQGMPSNCAMSGTRLYTVHHNPSLTSPILMRPRVPYGCATTNVPFPLAWPNPLPQFSFVVPDVCHDMHGTPSTGICPAGTDQIINDGDTWLSQNVPAFLSEGAIVIVTFDEGIGSDKTGGGGHVPTIMVGPGVAAGATDSDDYTHFGLLGGLEDYFGVSPLLGAAATAKPLPIPTATPLPAPSITDFTPTIGIPGDSVTITGTGFTNAYSVTFNGSPSVFTITNDSSITTTVSSGATTGPISVATAWGTASSTQSFTVSRPPGPYLLQHVLAKGSSTVIPTDTWSQPTASGDLLVVTIGWTGSGAPVPPAGWVSAVQTRATAIYYQANAQRQSGAVTFPLTFAGAWVMELLEWTGIATASPLDQVAMNTSKSLLGTTGDSGTTPPTSQPNEVAMSSIIALAAVTQSGPTNGFAQVDVGTQGTSDTTGFYSNVLTTTGGQDISVTLSAPARWRGVIATFRAE